MQIWEICAYDKNLGICSGRAWSISMNSIIDISCESFCMASLNLMPSPCKRNLQMVLKTQHCQLVHVKVGIIENYVGLRRTKELQGCWPTSGSSMMMPNPSLSSTFAFQYIVTWACGMDVIWCLSE